ncbi:Uncharacterized protein OBRU01_18952 [Operophtera brumata]|uniref:Uncharacterized protein n=1 Tax=Operophtera brumata TaxID=104452 RepID=A0A0L7KY80_OPEBR|nr:Uncharacterized protein OBRU01_18952 [Operophtera brumata]
MPIWKNMKGIPSEKLAAEGLMSNDWALLTPCQRECNTRLGMTIQLEQEAYLTQHPEVRAMLEIFLGKMIESSKRKDFLKDAAEHFTRPEKELDKEIRENLGLPSDGPYTKDLRDITLKHFPSKPWSIPTPSLSTRNTPSSSFLSIITSDTTIPTPEPIPTLPPTLSEAFFEVVSNTVDKAIFFHVDDKALRYDTAYIEVTKRVEEAMEIPVIEINEDIAELLFNAYNLFEMNIMEKEKIAAELAWERRMRKKMKRTLRRQRNFKGYETPPTPKSEVSYHESFVNPPMRPCICHPQFHYNRYAKTDLS